MRGSGQKVFKALQSFSASVTVKSLPLSFKYLLGATAAA